MAEKENESVTSISIDIASNGGFNLRFCTMERNPSASMYENARYESYNEAYGNKEVNKVIARVTELLKKGEE